MGKEIGKETNRIENVHNRHNMASVCWAEGTGGTRVARAPPVFWRERTQSGGGNMMVCTYFPFRRFLHLEETFCFTLMKIL